MRSHGGGIGAAGRDGVNEHFNARPLEVLSDYSSFVRPLETPSFMSLHDAKGVDFCLFCFSSSRLQRFEENLRLFPEKLSQVCVQAKGALF